jgi:hypothetical protein
MSNSIQYANVASLIRTGSRPRSGQTVSGYGRRLPTEWIATLVESPKIRRRVYAICVSNVASYYVRVRGERLYVADSAFPC